MGFALIDSPVSNNGRGLKLGEPVVRMGVLRDSPVSNNGRGLKRNPLGTDALPFQIRPLAITGVD